MLHATTSIKQYDTQHDASRCESIYGWTRRTSDCGQSTLYSSPLLVHRIGGPLPLPLVHDSCTQLLIAFVLNFLGQV